jgi:MFS family permease
MVLIALAAWSLDASTDLAGTIGALAAVTAASSILTSWVAAKIVVRLGPIDGIIASDAVACLGVLVSLGVATHVLSPAMLLVVGVIDGASGAIAAISFSWAAPVLAPTQRTRFNSVAALVDQVPALVGPALGLVAFHAVGLAPLMVIDLATYGVAIAALRVLRRRAKPELERPRSPRARRALSTLRRSGLPWRWQLTFSAVNLAGGIGIPLAATYVLTAGGANAWAGAQTASAAAAIVASLAITWRGGTWERAAVVLGLSILAAGTGRVAFALPLAPVALVGLVTVRAVAQSAANTLNTGVWQRIVDPSSLPEIFAIRRFVGQGPFVVGSLLGVPLALARPEDAGAVLVLLGVVEVLVLLAAVGTSRRLATAEPLRIEERALT